MDVSLILSKSPQETELLGEKFIYTCRGGDVLGLSGSLGSGKTTLVKGFAKGLGIPRKHILSPSFLLMRFLPVLKGNISGMYHIDLWRTEKLSQEDSKSIEEAISSQSTIVVIEWPSRLPNRLQQRITHHFQSKITGSKTRSIRITKKSSKRIVRKIKRIN